MYISCVAQALRGNFSFFVSVFASRIEQDFCILHPITVDEKVDTNSN